jgi:hypothetical protein
MASALPGVQHEMPGVAVGLSGKKGGGTGSRRVN